MARASARSRLHETSTRRRLLTLFAAWVIVCLAGAVAVALALAAADTARNDVSELDRVERDVAALAKSYVDQETGVRGYLLGGTDALLDPYHAGQTTSAGLIAEIRKEVHSDALRTMLDRVEQAARAWRTRIAEPDIALRRSGQATEAQLAESTGPGKQRFDVLRTQLAKLTAAANAADAARNDHERNLQRWALAATVATIAAAIAGAVVIWILIGRWITAPLETLAGAVREAGAHPDAGAMPAAGGTPEIRTLATEVDEMRRNIADQGVELALTRNESEERRRIIDELQRALLPAQRARIAGARDRRSLPDLIRRGERRRRLVRDDPAR